MNEEPAGQGPVERMVRPGAEARQELTAALDKSGSVVRLTSALFPATTLVAPLTDSAKNPKMSRPLNSRSPKLMDSRPGTSQRVWNTWAKTNEYMTSNANGVMTAHSGPSRLSR